MKERIYNDVTFRGKDEKIIIKQRPHVPKMLLNKINDNKKRQGHQLF